METGGGSWLTRRKQDSDCTWGAELEGTLEGVWFIPSLEGMSGSRGEGQEHPAPRHPHNQPGAGLSLPPYWALLLPGGTSLLPGTGLILVRVFSPWRGGRTSPVCAFPMGLPTGNLSIAGPQQCSKESSPHPRGPGLWPCQGWSDF